MPPYLAGRHDETDEFRRLLNQDVVLENLILTGLRGVGKTVLIDTFKPVAMQQGWLWVGTDMSESTSLTEERIALRLITDLAVVTSSMTIDRQAEAAIGFHRGARQVASKLTFSTMAELFNSTPGLTADKLKSVLELVWTGVQQQKARGLIFAYDEAQNLADHASKDEYPLSLLLDVFQSLQKKNIPFMLVLVGLPTLFPKLVAARTFAERMFRVLFLDRLNAADSGEAILRPMRHTNYNVSLKDSVVALIVRVSGGYPYFIQFMGREVYDVLIQQPDLDDPRHVPIDAITRKLDSDFFAGRWARATDRQRELLEVIARLEDCDSEFTVQEIAAQSRQCLARPFGSSRINQLLAALGEAGLVYKNRRGKYSFAVPLLGQFILRQMQRPLGDADSSNNS
jgi:hypothetical protein